MVMILMLLLGQLLLYCCCSCFCCCHYHYKSNLLPCISFPFLSFSFLVGENDFFRHVYKYLLIYLYLASSYTLFFHSLGGDNGRVNLEVQKVECSGWEVAETVRSYEEKGGVASGRTGRLGLAEASSLPTELIRSLSIPS